ncbi:MAG: hypothetical protein IKL85_09030 [Lentisphaeria bacterium]|nr:hypothetical protein [Lentisphaeria bacterium]
MPLPGTNTGSAPGFLTTTARLCAGTKILTEIYDSSPARAIWRFLLLTILCAIMASVVGTFVQKGVFERAGRNLDEEIGAFVVTPETISVQKEPDTPRRFKLPYITLEYYPGNTFASEDFNVGRTSDHGIVILPGGLASWASVNWKGEDLFYSTLLPASMLYASLSEEKDAGLNDVGAHWEMFSGPGFSETLKEKFAAPKAKTADKASPSGNTPAILTTGSQAARFAVSLLSAIILLTTFVRNFFEIGLIVLLVSLVQYLRASTLPKGIIFKNVLTIMVYSTFPAQIAATLFDAAGGDRYIQFQFLFVGIFFVYQLFAFRAVMKKVCPQIERKNDDFDDSDF